MQPDTRPEPAAMLPLVGWAGGIGPDNVKKNVVTMPIPPLMFFVLGHVFFFFKAYHAA